jgi:hypothetical protein
MSGSYEEDNAPEGVMADAFYIKGQKTPSELFQTAADVIQRADRHEDERTLVWARRISTDTSGTSFALISCTDCLRSFMVVALSEDIQVVHEARCVFCKSEIQYISEKHNANQNRGDLPALLGDGQNSSTKAMSHTAK